MKVKAGTNADYQVSTSILQTGTKVSGGNGYSETHSHRVPINLHSAVERTSLCVDIALCGAAVIFH